MRGHRCMGAAIMQVGGFRCTRAGGGGDLVDCVEGKCLQLRVCREMDWKRALCNSDMMLGLD